MRILTFKPYLAIILTLAWSIACVQAQFTFQHIGTGETGSLTPNAQPGSFTLVGGGNDIWSVDDNFDYAYGDISGDFDIRVRVESLEPVARWTKAGIMVRENLNPASRMAFNRVTPPNVPTTAGGNGANDSRFAYRTGTTSGGQGEHEDGTGAPEYPNGWLRVTRAGNVINAYASSDGQTWRLQGSQDTAGWEGGALPGTLHVGLGVSRHSSDTGDTLAVCEFRDYGTPNSDAFISTQPASQTVEDTVTATFRFTATGGLDIYDIQWRKNGSDIPGANGASYTTPVQGVSESGSAYSVSIRNKLNGTTATSADAILTIVPDVTPPVLLSATASPGISTSFIVRFSEPVNEAEAETIGNYSVSGGITLSAAELLADNRSVRITSSRLTAPGCHVLTVNDVHDRAGVPNNIAANSMTGVIYSDGVIRYRQYNNITTVEISALRADPDFPNNPNRNVYHNLLENPEGGGNHFNDYGALMDGFITAPVSGDYVFYVAADDHAEFWLSTTDNPANKVLIAREPDWAGFREFTGNSGGRRPCALPGGACENVSQPVTLQAGCRYAFEFLYKEGGGGDYGSVAWQTPPNGPQPGNAPGEPIPGAYLSPSGATAPVLAAAQPANQSISENQPLNLAISVTSGTPTFHIQWFKNGNPIPGATGMSISIANAALSDAGSYHATISNGYGDAVSRTAVVEVTIDVVAPSLVSALAPAGNGTQFDLVFTEPVNESDVETLSKYSLPGVTINSAVLQADNKTVRITTSNMHTDGCKILTVGEIRDRAIPPNTFAGGMIGVVAARGTIRYHQFDNTGSGVAVANLLSHPSFPNSPTRIVNATDFENPEEGGNNFQNYGAQMLGYVHPPVSGAYRFFLAADDGAALWISSDENAANKVLVASEPIWSAFRAYTGTGGGGGGRNCGGPTTCNISPPLNLQAGCKYFVEMIYKEGGGGDYGSVAWQLPGGPEPANGSDPIQAQFLSPYEVAASVPADQPADATVLEGRFVTFTANFRGSPPLLVQWLRDGVPIPGATGSSITLGPLQHPEDDGAKFTLTVSNQFANVTSREAVLTVIPDTAQPVPLLAAGSTTRDRITVTFDELVDASADDTFSYDVSDGVSILTLSSATRQADGKTVILVLAPENPLNFNTPYTVKVNGVFDISGNQMVDPPDVTLSFHSVVEGCGGVAFEAFNTSDQPGNAVSILVNHPNFPNNPDFRQTIPGMNSRLATGPNGFYSTDAREQYGARMRGVYVPPISGNWMFHVAADDGTELWLNPNGIDPAGKVRIFEMAGCCATFAASASAPQTLIGGRPYYIELLYKEGGGGDYGQVAARLQGSSDPLVPIGAADLGQYAEPGYSGTLSFAQPPTDQTVTENRVATFTATAVSSAGLPICHQWFRDGVAIPGATGPSYSFRTVLSDNGAVFSVRASIVGNIIDSPMATLNVLPDVAAPTLLSASGTDTLRHVILRFDEELGQASAETAGNYTIAGLTVDSAVLLYDKQSVRLATSLQAEGTVYTVVVTSVADIAATPNPISSQSANFTSYVFTPGFLRFAYFPPGPGQTDWLANNALDTTLLVNPKYPDYPDQVLYMPVADTRSVFPDNSHEAYGARVSGVFIPPTSGNWLFYLASDDPSRLFLNAAGADSAGKALIAEETSCCGGWVLPGAGRVSPSAPQALTAGSHYYMEAIFKEGTGGDYMKIATTLEGAPVPSDNPSGQLPISAFAIKASSLGTYVPPNGATGTITQQPTDIASCINPLIVNQEPIVLTVGAEASPAGTQMHIRWQRLVGSEWQDTVGTGPVYSFPPDTADNGSRWRAAVFVLGAPAPIYSSEITLSVHQANTPPQFTLGSSASSAEDAAPQSVAGFANVTSPHSIPRLPAIDFSTDFATAPAGIILRGVNNPGATQGAAVRNGRLELTTPNNSAYGSAVLGTGPSVVNYESLEISWKSYLGDGNTGADGVSLSIGDNIPDDPGYGGEEGWAGVPLSVAVDTFENGAIDPWGDGGNNGGPEGGLELKSRDAILAFQMVPNNNPGSGAYLRKSAFVPVKLTVSATGFATYDYDGVVLSAQIPNYTGIRANRVMFWARTGGANDNQWVDDLNIKAFVAGTSSAENNQTVAFEVSNDNPALFSSQPAISPNGTLTYASAPDACGLALVTVVARDDGGTICNGDDTSDPKTFTINIECRPDPPVATPQSITAAAGVPKAITLTGTDVDGDPLTAAVASNPQHGTLSVQGGVLHYTADAAYAGPDSFTFTVNDGTFTSAPATVNIIVIPNTPPNCVAAITPSECGVTFDNGGKLYAIAVEGGAVCLTLDGSGTTDAEGDPIAVTWIIDGTNTVSGTIVTNCLDLGCHTITLIANDGIATCQTTIDLCVITPAEACEQIITLVENTTVERKNKRPLIVSLKAAKVAFERSDEHNNPENQMSMGGQMLQVFQHKVRAQIASRNPAEAAAFIAAAEDVLQALECSLNLPPKSDE